MSRIPRGISLLIPALLVLCASRWPALGDASFGNHAPTLAIAAHIAAAGQAIEDSLVISLTHDSPCSITVSVATPGDEQLKNGSASLTTFYKLTGAAISNPDAAWVPAATFVGQSYTIPGTGPADNLTLWAKGVAPNNAAPDAGLYTAAVILTVTW